MNQYIVLNRIKVQNANCIAGFTWGFPAITHFLGFTHLLQRKLSNEYDIKFSGCAVVSHDYQLHVYKPKPTANLEFIQSKNPPVLAKHKKSSPPIIEEGKMNLTISIIIEVSKELVATTEKIKLFKQTLLDICLMSRIAGGTIISLSLDRINIFSASTDEQLSALNKKVKRLIMPGFVLQDRSDYLKEHFDTLKQKDSKIQLLDAWLDFSAIKYQAKPIMTDKETSPSLDTKAEWKLQAKPKAKGWLVPIMTGYKAISVLSDAGEVSDSRDFTCPTCFVEAIHSIGEWKSIHRITDIGEMIWIYQYKDGWYICTQNVKKSQIEESVIVENNTINFENALANL